MTKKNVIGRSAVGITLALLSGLLLFGGPVLASVAGPSRAVSTRQFQAAPAVSTDNASSITSSAAMLNGTIINMADSSSVVRFFDWGPSTSYGQEILLPGTANTTGTFSAPLYGLLANTTYHFRARVLGLSGGGYVNGEDKTFTTSPLPPALPFLLKWGKLGPGDGDFNRPDGIAMDSDGNVYVSDGNGRVQKFDALGNFVLKWGSIGEGNGQFYGAVSLAVDGSGNVYAADNNMSRIQKFSDNGTFLGIVASYGSLEGQLNRPEGVTTDSQGNLYVADTQNNRIQKLSNNGSFLAKWGTVGSGPGQFRYPTDVAVDGEGNVYVADRENYRIQKFTNSGNFTMSWDANLPDQGYLDRPTGLSFDAASNTLYVANFDNDRINAFDPAGGVAGKFGSTGSAAGQFSGPIDVAVGPQGDVYVVDQANNRVQVFGHTPLAPASVSTDPASAITQNTVVLNGTLNNLPEGTSGNVSFDWGSSPSVLPNDTLPVTMTGGGSYTASLTGLTPVMPYYFRAKLTVGAAASYGEVQTFFTPPPLLFKLGGFANGDGQLITPQGVATDPAGNIFVSDSSLSKVKKFSRTGSPITEWTPQDPGPGIANSPQGLAVDNQGSVYVIDGYEIQKFTNAGEFVTRWGGYGSADGQFNGLVALAVDSHDVVYAVGWGDDRVQKFDSSGAFIGKWRTGFIPCGIALDASHNVYIAEVSHDRIHKYSDNGTLITWWGSAGTGDGQFQFAQPMGIAVDRDGTVYVTDGNTFNSGRIQMFSDNGTFIGTWGTPGSGDYQFRSPNALAIDGTGHLAVVDEGNSRVQVFAMTAMPVVTTLPVTSLTTTSAILNGAVISLDSAPSVSLSFEWGQAADSLTRETPAVSVNHTGGFSKPITGLATNIIYYFRAKIVAGGLIGYGEVLRFATPPPFLSKWGSQGSSDGRFSNPHGIAVDGLGNVYVADSYNDRIEKFTASGQFITKWGTTGTGDGQFQYPLGLAVDSLGNVFVADTGNARVQKFTASGQLLTSWGTRGTADGQFDGPSAIAVDQSGNVYVTEFGNDRVQKFTNSGGFLTKWGSLGGPDIRFDSPSGIAVDPSGLVYVVDSYTEWVQKFTPTGELVGKWGSGGSGDGQFQSAFDVAIDAAGNVYVVDAGNHRVQRFTGSGEYLAQWGSSGTGDGQFYDVYGIAVSPTGNVYVVEGNSNNRVQVFGFTVLAPAVTTSFASSVTPQAAVLNGVLNSLGGSGSADVSFEWGTSGDNLSQQTTLVSTSHTGSFTASISGLAENTTYYFLAKAVRSGVASFGYVLSFPTPGPLAVITGDAIQVTASGAQLIGNLVSLGGAASVNVSFEWGQSPGSLTQETPAIPMAATGTYRADLTGLATTTYYFRSKAVSGDKAVLETVHSFTTPPPFLFVFGGFGSGDGMLIDPKGITIDSDGNVYVVDELNFCVQKFTANGTFVTRWGSQGAGNGQFNRPQGIAVDGAGNVYVADADNHRIQKFTASGEYVTQWPSSTVEDGPYAAPAGIVVDSSGNIYVADTILERVAKFSPSGELVTKWGSQGIDDGQFNHPCGMAIDSAGTLYVVDSYGNRIQKFSDNGTFLGKWGAYGQANGEFFDPNAIAIDASDVVYVADMANYRVQMFTRAGVFIYGWVSSPLGWGDGQFGQPVGIAVHSGNIYVLGSGRVHVFGFTNPMSVATGNATDVTFNSAVLNGELISLGTSANVGISFEWGLTADCDNETSLVSSNQTGAFSVNVTGLAPATTYYFRARAAGNGTVFGAVRSFNTRGPLAVVTGPAENVGPFGARLSGNLTGTGLGPSVSVCFGWSRTAGGPYSFTPAQSVDSTGPFSVNLGSLSANTTYYFRARADGDTSVAGDEMNFKTLVPVRPSVMTLTAGGITHATATLSGNVTSLGTAPSANVSFQWGTASGHLDRETALYATVSTGLFNASLSGLTASTTYYFRAKADGGPHGAAYGEEMSFAATAAPPTGGGLGGFGGGGGGGPTGPGVTNLTIYTNDEGLFNLAATPKSDDSKAILSIAKGVRARTKDDSPLKSVKIVPFDNPPAAPTGSNLISLVYEITPAGAAFNPGISLTLLYDPASLPANTDVDNLSIAVLNTTESRWELLKSVVNKTDASVTTTIEHLSVYAIIGRIVVPPPPPLPPAPASFTISDLTVSPATIIAGQSVTISAKVNNTGGTGGECSVTLKMNDVETDTKEVSVAAGSSETVSFAVSGSAAGKYDVDVSGATGSFTVTQPETMVTTMPVQTPTTGSPPAKGLSAVLVVVIVLGVLFIAGCVLVIIRLKR